MARDDDVEPIPSIVPKRDSEQQFATARGRGNKGRVTRKGAGRRSEDSSGGGSGLLARLVMTVSLVIAAIACAWAWQLQEQFQQAQFEMERSNDRISDLEDLLSDTDDNVVTLEPLGQTVTLQAGVPHMFNTDQDFVATATARFSITQMLTRTDDTDEGDPAMGVLVPVSQFRDDYVVFTPATFTKNYVNIIAPMGAALDVDGWALPPLTPIGSSGWGRLRIPLGEGDHLIVYPEIVAG